MSGPNGPDWPGGSGGLAGLAGRGGPGSAGRVAAARTGEPSVAVVLGTASGGTARHAGMLAEGCRRAGLAMLAIGPASAQPAFRAGADAWSDGGRTIRRSRSTWPRSPTGPARPTT